MNQKKMGLTQTKLHHKILKESWSSILTHLTTPIGQHSARQPNPLGDLPLHLACYGGQAPPSVIRALILAYPAAAETRNRAGFLPVQLARINYRVGGRWRREVLDLLRGSFFEMALAAAASNGYGSAIAHRSANHTGGTGIAPGGVLCCEGGMGGFAVPPEHTYQSSVTCVVCLDAQADHVVVPCGHVCLCVECAGKVRKKGMCPVGRCVVSNIVLVARECKDYVGLMDGAVERSDSAEVEDREEGLPLTMVSKV